jgi:polysaccharide export outer membrane protein
VKIGTTVLGLSSLLLVSQLVPASPVAWAEDTGQRAQPGQAPPAPATPAQKNGPAPTAADYRIGPEDLLDISVWNNPALSRTVPVRPDGKISLPLLNDVQAAGLTPMQLRAFIAKKLTEYMPNPEVSLMVREVNRFKVSVIGEVKKPGRFGLKSEATVLDAIALAGGFSDFASPSRIVIVRRDGAGTKRVPVDSNEIISTGSEQANVYLQPGDLGVVP